MWLLKNIYLSPAVLETGKSKIEGMVDLELGESLLHRRCLSLLSSHSRKDKADLWSLFYQGTDPHHEDLSHNATNLGVRAQCINLERTQTFTMATLRITR